MAQMSYFNGEKWVAVAGGDPPVPSQTMAFGVYSRLANPDEFTVWGYNVSSVSEGLGAGRQFVNFEVPLPSDKYTVTIGNGRDHEGVVCTMFTPEITSSNAADQRTKNLVLIGGLPINGPYTYKSYDNFDFCVHYDNDREIISQPAFFSTGTPTDGRVVLFEVGDGVGVVYPSACTKWSLEDIALKDVPSKKRFKFARLEDIPKGVVFRDAWITDFSDHDGVGLGATEFFRQRGFK